MSSLAEIQRRLAARPPQLLEVPARWRPAGVLVPLLPSPGGLRLVLIRRSAHLARHSGQVAFPGGGREPGDPSLEHTALREAWEEIALDPAGVQVLGRLDEVWTPSGFVLSPFVALVTGPTAFRPQAGEVDEVLEAPLEALLDLSVFREEAWEWDGVCYPVVHFDLPAFTIWGATGRIVARLLEVCFGWQNPGTLGLPRLPSDLETLQGLRPPAPAEDAGPRLRRGPP